jgi:hypothetical protein
VCNAIDSHTCSVVVAQPVRLEKGSCGICAVHFEALVIAAMTCDQTKVVEHRADIQQLRVIGQSLALAAQGTEQKHPARVVIKQFGFDVADVFGGGSGEGAVRDLDAGDSAGHNGFLVEKRRRGAAGESLFPARQANNRVMAAILAIAPANRAKLTCRVWAGQG